VKKKITIIGGGITGVVIAIYLCEKYDVTIYEGGNSLGGVLSDINHKNNFFLNGCHYLNVKSDWYKKVHSIIKKDLDIFNYTTHSFTEYLDHQTISSNKFECPVIKKIKFKTTNKLKNITLSDRFDLYDKDISIFLKDIVRKLKINPDDLIYDNAINFQLDRITSIEDENRIKKLKEKQIYDQIYALESKKLKIFHKAALPINGYNVIFEKFKNYLISKNVKIFCGKKVIPIWENKHLKLNYNKKIIDSEKIIWTANPVGLIYKYFLKPLESKSFRVKQLDFEYDNNFFKNIYIQVFSKNTSIFRIFLYKSSGKQKISVECSDFMKEHFDEIIKKLVKILISFKIGFIKSNLKFIGLSTSSRHDICTVHDFDMISKFRNSIKKSNLITSDWEVYGRDAKIKNLLIKLKREKII
tara:strand:- start:831 stop:2069 length:1239 start_codon:yes stop_codon:yes gene_type:complete